MPNKEVPSILKTELTDQINIQISWGKEEYRGSIYQIQYKGSTISFLPFERIGKNQPTQSRVFAEHIVETQCDLAVIEYLPSTLEGRIKKRTHNYYKIFEQLCESINIPRGDFDLVRNNEGNIIYQLFAITKSVVEISYIVNFLKDSFKEKLTRREFLKSLFISSYIGLTIILPGLVAKKTTTSVYYIIPNLVRTANIAQNIANYIDGDINSDLPSVDNYTISSETKFRNQATNVTVLYPPVHCAWIRYFIEHPIARSIYYNIGKSIFPESAFKPIIVDPPKPKLKERDFIA